MDFDPALRDRLVERWRGRGVAAPVLPTGAGHDAGILAARLPTAMLFVRNPTGVSHSPGRARRRWPTAWPGWPRSPTCSPTWQPMSVPAP